jgi:hypothetical protein
MKKQITPQFILGILGTLGLFGFIGYNVKDIVIGAPLSVRMVKDGATVADPYLPITGNARHAQQVHINGRQVPIDQEGNFSDGVILSPGYNIVTITQKDRFGNQKEKVVHLVAESQEDGDAVTIHYQKEE